MSSAWLSATIQEFEQVTLDNGTELFLVRARARQEDDPEPRPMFETREQDGTAHTYEPLSSGGDRRGLLRLAYAVPTERVGPSTAFSLRLPGGYRIELPEPTPGDSVAENDDDKTWRDVDPSADREQPGLDNGAAWQIAKLEQELASARQSTARLTARLRQLEARNELLRADATSGRPGDGERLRQLESERAQLATHVRALAELLSSEKSSVDVEPGGAVAVGAADRLETIRARAVREANELAARELRRLRAGAPL